MATLLSPSSLPTQTICSQHAKCELPSKALNQIHRPQKTKLLLRLGLIDCKSSCSPSSFWKEAGIRSSPYNAPFLHRRQWQQNMELLWLKSACSIGSSSSGSFIFFQHSVYDATKCLSCIKCFSWLGTLFVFIDTGKVNTLYLHLVISGRHRECPFCR